jgi:hypothetical protein
MLVSIPSTAIAVVTALRMDDPAYGTAMSTPPNTVPSRTAMKVPIYT